MKKWAIIIFVGLAIMLVALTAIHLATLKNDPTSFSNYLKDKNNTSSVDIVKIVEDQREIFILYRGDDSKIAMAYFEPSKIMKSRYVYSGSAKSSSIFSSYNFGTPQETMIVIYGDNTNIKADKVSFTNGSTTYTEKISDEDYVLTIYRFKKGDSISAEKITLLDKDGNRIEQN